MIYKTLAFALLLLIPLTGQEWSYIGIPYVTDDVPDEIMPTLPDGPAVGNAWPYDPCSIPTPVFADGVKQYYVDSVNGDDGTAGNSGRGSVALPRKTLPGLAGENWTLAEGEQVFMTGNSTFISTGATVNLSAAGTAENQCWLIGVNGQPRFNGDRFYIDGSHILLDNLRFEPGDGSLRLRMGDGLPLSYATLRNSTLQGDSTGNASGAALGGKGTSSSPVDFVMVYNNVIQEFGAWERETDNDGDHHGVQFTFYIYHVWVIDNYIARCEGNGIQTSVGNSSEDYALRPHYVYYGGNTFENNWEYEMAHKNAYHVIASGNTFKNHSNPVKSAAYTAVLHIDEEGWLSGYRWTIFNQFVNCQRTVKLAASQATIVDWTADPPVQTAGSREYVLGNVMVNTGGIQLGATGSTPNPAQTDLQRTWPEFLDASHNTLALGNGVINQYATNGTTGELCDQWLEGNLIWREATESTTSQVIIKSNASPLPTSNYFYRGAHFREDGLVSISAGNAGSPRKWTEIPHYTEITDQELLLDEAWQPAANSPAVGLTQASPSYAEFESLYGINIEVDINGVPRPAMWTAGAFESGATQSDSAPVVNFLPVISGATWKGPEYVGETLKANPGIWKGYPVPTYTYQWSRCDINGDNPVGISGATDSTYTLTGSDAGGTVRVTATATNSQGSSSAVSLQSFPIEGGEPSAPANVTPPVATGDATVGSTLITTDGSWSANPSPAYTYQWFRGVTPIAGATSSTYTLGQSDLGAMIKSNVTATNSEGSANEDSNEVGPITSEPEPGGEGSILTNTLSTGTFTIGQ